MAANPVLPHDDRGAGTPVIFLHGFPLHRGIWKNQLDPVASKHRAIAFDLPGFGQASTLRCPDTLNGFTAMMDASAHLIASPPAVLVGHSMGGYMALEQCGDHPERVRALILVSTRSEADSDEQVAARHDTIAQLRQEGPGSFSVQSARNLLAPANASNADLFMPVLQMIRSTPVSSLVSTLVALATRPDFTEFAEQIQVPTLVLWGEDDRIVPPEQSQALAKAIPGARGVGIPGAGHLTFLENPTAFNQAVMEFLEKLPALEADRAKAVEDGEGTEDEDDSAQPAEEETPPASKE